MSGIFGGGNATPSASPVTSLRLQTSTRGRPIPILYGKPRVAANLIWYGDLIATGHQQSSGGKGGGGQSSTSYTYTAALIMGVSEGVINSIPRVWRQKEVFTDPTDACAQIGLSYSPGTYSQTAAGWMITKHPTEALAYRGLSYISAANYALGDNADLLNHSFEVDTASAYSASIRDANPKDVITDLLTNSHYGAGFPAAKLGDMTLFSQYCVANNIFISPAYLEQAATREMLTTLMTITNAGALYSQGLLRFVPFGDAAATANGVTFSPNITPVYDLTDDDFLGDDSSDPVKVSRSSNADAYNCVRVKFYNRDNNYNEEIVEAKDQASIELFGLRAMDVMDIKELCDATAARSVAQLTLQRSLYIRNTFEFQLGWSKALLEPMDLVTLTDAGMGMVKLPVRILSIEEDDFGYLTVTAEEFPLNVCNAATYSTQPAVGYAANFNAAPGDTNGEVVFEAPIELCASHDSLELWVAAGGGANYGGCEVWVSLDNATYRREGTITGKSRFGTITSSLATVGAAGITAQSVGVALQAGGQMLSGTDDDVALLNTLCFISGEFLAYKTAQLTAVDTYTLSKLNRGAYRSGQAQHNIGDTFVRIDDSIAKISLTQDYIGKTIYIKLLAFNQFGGGLQALSDVNPATFLVTGRFIRQAPHDVSGLAISVKADGTRQFVFDADLASKDVANGGGYRIKYRKSGSGVTWQNMTPLHTGLLTSSPFETHGPGDGVYDFGVEAVDARGNESLNAALLSNVIIGAADFIDARSGTSVASDNIAQTIAALNAKIAANKAEAAQSTADAVTLEITNIASDAVLARGEKSAVMLDYATILADQAGGNGLDAQAVTFGQSAVAYDAAVTALTVYLTSLVPAYNDTTTNTPIAAATFRQKFIDVYSAKQLLVNAIAAKAKSLADAAALTATWPGIVSQSGTLTTGNISSVIGGGAIGTSHIANNAVTEVLYFTFPNKLLTNACENMQFFHYNYSSSTDGVVVTANSMANSVAFPGTDLRAIKYFIFSVERLISNGSVVLSSIVREFFAPVSVTGQSIPIYLEEFFSCGAGSYLELIFAMCTPDGTGPTSMTIANIKVKMEVIKK
jgi:hypothetical protein